MTNKEQIDRDAERIKCLRTSINEEMKNADIAREALMIAEKYRLKADHQREMLNQIQRGEEPRAHGWWIVEHAGNGWNDWTNLTCSLCGNKIEKATGIHNYCPACGGGMDLEGPHEI